MAKADASSYTAAMTRVAVGVLGVVGLLLVAAGVLLAFAVGLLVPVVVCGGPWITRLSRRARS
jgi:hypothetical protein